MSVNFYVLSEDDRDHARRNFDRQSRTRANRPRGGDEDPISQAGSSYICRMPDSATSIPERNGTTLGSLAGCFTQKVSISGELTDAIEVKVWNPYLYKMYKAAHPYFQVHQNKWGLLICEKPRAYHKGVVANADIEPNSFGAVDLNFGGQITAHLNWMTGNQKVSVGRQVEVEFFEEENHWVIVNADCEVQL